MYRCTSVPVYLSTGVLVHQCIGVPVYQCTGVPVYWRTGVPWKKVESGKEGASREKGGDRPVRQGDYQSGKEEAPVRKRRRRRSRSRSKSRSKWKRGEGGGEGGGARLICCCPRAGGSGATWALLQFRGGVQVQHGFREF